MSSALEAAAEAIKNETACGRCHYADPVITDDDEPSPVLICRRYPPTVADDDWSLRGHRPGPQPRRLRAGWPAVNADDWCGEFRPGDSGS